MNMITVISGTNRQESNSLKVAKSCCNILLNKGMQVKLFSLMELPENFLINDMFGNPSSGFKKLVEEFIIPADKFVFVIPEYNGSFPGVLKAFIDAIDYLSLKGKKATLVGLASGHAGGLRPLDHFTAVLHHINIEVMSNKSKLSNIEKLTDAEIVNDKQTIEKLSNQLDQFVNF